MPLAHFDKQLQGVVYTSFIIYCLAILELRKDQSSPFTHFPLVALVFFKPFLHLHFPSWHTSCSLHLTMWHISVMKNKWNLGAFHTFGWSESVSVIKVRQMNRSIHPEKGFIGFLLYRKVFLPAYLCSCINALYSHVTNVTITQNLILCLFDLMLRVKSVKFSSIFKPT